MKDANGREIEIGDRVRRKIPHQFEIKTGPEDKDWAGASDPSIGARVTGFTQGNSVVCTAGWRGQIPVFLAETLEVMD